jgi:mono/diheme cytochrome c family protein
LPAVRVAARQHIKPGSIAMTQQIKISAIIAAGAIALLPHHAGAQAAKPTLYTADQATAGAAVYQQTCASCHGGALEGVSAPALKGAAFGDMATAQSLTADSLLEATAASMPQSDPGSLKPDEYNAVVAYILQQNGYPAGIAPLAPHAAGLSDAKIMP